jgi:membrane protein YqaA with SNARE-associated domain
VDLSLALVSGIWTWIHRLGGPGLIVVGIVDGSAIPLPGSIDVFLIILAAHHRQWWPYYALMATVGAVVGGYLTYRLAEKGGEETLERKIGRQRAKKLYDRFKTHGFATVVVGAVLPPPFPTFPVVLTAGALQYPWKNFLLALTLGRSVRYFALGFVAHIYGKVIIATLSQYYKPLLYALIALAVLGALGALVYFKWYRPRHQHQHPQHA